MDAPAGFDEGAASTDIFAGEANSFPRRNRGEQGYVAVVGFGQGFLLQDDGVCVGGEDGAGKDAGAGAVGQQEQRRIAGFDGGVNAESSRFLFVQRGEVFGAKGVAIDGSVIESRDVEVGQDGFCGDALEGLVEGDGFTGERADSGEDLAAGLIEGDHDPG